MGRIVVGAHEASAGRETLPSEGTPSVVIEWAGTYDSIVYMIEIRNAGSEAVDLGDFQLAAGSCSNADEGFRVVKGSSRIAPGERALILTHSSVPTDDEPRQQYANLLVATGLADSLTIQRASTLTLVDAGGAFSDVPLGPVMAGAAVGECCRPLTGGGSQDCMNQYGSFPCTGTTGGCWVLSQKPFAVVYRHAAGLRAICQMGASVVALRQGIGHAVHSRRSVLERYLLCSTEPNVRCSVPIGFG